MNIELKKIHISNFKGIKDLTIDLGQVTNIMADNGKGKTTIFDAFCWVLFNKDSLNNAKFNIRPIHKSGAVVDLIDIVVELTLLVDGKEVILKKTQKQKWVKKHNSKNETFEGNINEYEIDGFPKTEKDFNEYISQVITGEVFMITTNPAYFPGMKWKEQREALMKLVSEITDADVIATEDMFKPLEAMLEENDVEAWRSKYTKALKEYNKQIDDIPSRIDEVSKNIIEVDYSSEELKLKALQEDLAKVEEDIENKSKPNEALLDLNQRLFEKKKELQDTENKIKSEYDKALKELCIQKDKLDYEFNNLFRQDKNIQVDIELKEKELSILKKQLPKLRELFKEIDQEELKEDALNCPTCSQALPEDRKQNVIEEFKDNKKRRLIATRDRGIKANEETEELKKGLEELKKDLEEIIARKTEIVGETNGIIKKIEEYPELKMIDSPKWVDLGAQCKDLEYQITIFDDGKSLTDSLKAKKQEIQEKIDEVKKILNQKEVVEKAKERVKELTQEQRELAQKVADTEKMLVLFEDFTKTKMDMLSMAINGKFSLVRWKLFDIQINGGMKETCELTLNGVPYSDLNSAGKVQAGLDIINTMSAIYEVTAPIFIDNREGVNEIPEVKAQVINLIVTKDDEIKVEVA